MDVRPTLAALRHDDSEWRRGQQTFAKAQRAWRADPAAAPVLAALKRFGKGAAIERCGALADLFASGSAKATNLAASLVAAGIAALDAHPLGQMPLAHGSRDAVPALVLARSGRATLGLVAYDGEALAAVPAPRSVRFQPVESWMTVLAGAARGEHIVRRDGPDGGAVLHAQRLALGVGEVLYRYGPREALHLRRVDGVLVTLRLERMLEDAGPVAEHRLPDGALLHNAAPRRDDSRRDLMLAVLASMGRHGEAPAPVAAGAV